MRWPSFLSVCLLTVAAVAGWAWGWHESNANREFQFVRQRLALLESENRRLGELLTAQRRAEESAAERDARAAIERKVTELRRLDLQRPIRYREIPRDELPQILREKLARQIPDQEFGDTGVALAALGLLPAGIDLKKTYLDLLGEQIGAFYDQHTAELYTFRGNSLGKAQNRVILAHELTHALEDQHFGLGRLPLEAKGNDDRALAASALVEGDATLVMNRFMTGDLSASMLRDSLAGALSTDVRQLAAAPRYLRAALLFPYLRGQEFCAALYEQGGWSALAHAFEHPPTSTSQILHPERYLAQPEVVPSVVDLGPAALLSRKPLDDNVLGEFGTAQFLAKWLEDEGMANRVAAGWRGDRFRVYGDEKQSSYLWKTVWVSDAAASQFFEAAKQAVTRRYSHEQDAKTAPSAGSTEGGVFTLAIQSPGRHVQLRCRGEWVTLIDAQDSTWLTALGQSEEFQQTLSH